MTTTNKPRCDVQGCTIPPVYVCECPRCDREPAWDYEEHFFACEAHKQDVKQKHWRIRERPFDGAVLKNEVV